jgi:hypothetical protein
MPRSKTQLLNPTILESAIQVLEIQRNKLDEHIEEIRALLGRRSPGRPARSTEGHSEQHTRLKRRQLSAAAKRRISAAQKKRWAATRAEQQSKENSARTKKAAQKNKV